LSPWESDVKLRLRKNQRSKRNRNLLRPNPLRRLQQRNRLRNPPRNLLQHPRSKRGMSAGSGTAESVIQMLASSPSREDANIS
jgi:hypothetical protein